MTEQPTRVDLFLACEVVVNKGDKLPGFEDVSEAAPQSMYRTVYVGSTFAAVAEFISKQEDPDRFVGCHFPLIEEEMEVTDEMPSSR